MLDLPTQPQKNRNGLTAYDLDELVWYGVKAALSLALQQEANEYIKRHANKRDKHGRRLVVRNGFAKERTVTIGTWTTTIKAPRINDRRKGHKFTSNILPPYLHKSRSTATVIPAHYLRGLSGNAFQEGLEALLGKDAHGLSESLVASLKRQWPK